MEEKFLGYFQKCGLSIVSDELPYAERLRRPGFTLLTGYGSDSVSITTQIAARSEYYLLGFLRDCAMQ